MNKKWLVKTLTLFSFALSATLLIPHSSQAWYDGSWLNRRIITFTNSAATENLTNFPILVKLTASNFDFSKAQSAGQDIRFVDSNDSTVLSYEIEKWDGPGQEAIIWVKVPQIDIGTSDTIYMYYNNSGASDGQNAANVWTNSYMAVFHFAQTSGNYLDSTANDVDCPTVTVASRTATGKYGYAPDFNGLSNRLDCDPAVNIGDVSQEAWINVDTSGVRPIVQHAAAGETDTTNISYGFELDGSSNLWQQWEHGAGVNDTVTSTSTVSLATWTHVGANRDVTANTVTWYRNGTQYGTPAFYGLVNDPTDGSTGSLYIGARISSAVWFDGRIDELRVSGTVRSASWMRATYLSMNEAFQSYGSEESNASNALTVSSAAHQSFAVNDTATSIQTITITEGDTPSITSANDIRITIPAGFNMRWDTSDTSATIGGSASGKVSTTASYEDSGRTLLLDVTSNLNALETVTVAGLSFTSFTATSSLDNLDLVVAGSGGGVADSDDKTILVAAPTISSAANQTFEVSGATTTISTITLTESAGTSTINSTNDIRITIPAGFNMRWDTSDTTATIGGTASAKVSTTVSYEDSGRTLVLDVTSNFTTGQTLTVAGLSFANFTANSSSDNLDLVIRGSGGGIVATDARTIQIVTSTITLAGSVSQPSTVTTGVTDKVFGAVSLSRNAGTGQVTAVTLSESGTITANTELENIELWLSYDATWSSGDNQLGSVGSFSSGNGSVTFTETWNATTSPQYLIVRGDVTSGATSGDTIEITIASLTTTDTVVTTPFDISGTSTVSPDWWDLTWGYRKKITIDNTGREELTNFPYMVKLTSSNFDFSKASSTGADLRFIDDDGSTELSYEIEFYSTSTQTAVIWVKVPSIAAGSATDYISIYYGKSGVSSTQVPEDVWTNGYVAVYHFAQQSGKYLDSTSNNNDSDGSFYPGTPSVNQGPTRNPGDDDADGVYVFSRNNTDPNGLGYFPLMGETVIHDVSYSEGTYIAVASSPSIKFGTGSFSVMTRVRPNVAHLYDQDIIRKGSTNTSSHWWKIEWGDQSAPNNDILHYNYHTPTEYNISQVLVPDGSWHNFWITRNAIAATASMYVDGVISGSPVSVAVADFNSNANMGIGSKDTLDDDHFPGHLDEVRLSNVLRSSDWIAAEDDSLNNTLSTFGSQQTSPDVVAPTVSITAPTASATVSGTTTTITATASDAVGVAGVTFKIGNAELAAEDTSFPYSIVWDTTSVADGNVSLIAVARDAAGNYATSSAVSVTVHNEIEPDPEPEPEPEEDEDDEPRRSSGGGGYTRTTPTQTVTTTTQYPTPSAQPQPSTQPAPSAGPNPNPAQPQPTNEPQESIQEPINEELVRNSIVWSGKLGLLTSLITKFPELKTTLDSNGVSQDPSLQKIVGVRFELPKFGELAGLNGSTPIAIRDLSTNAIKKVPEEVVFSRTPDESLDLTLNVTLTETGEVRQTLEAVEGQKVKLFVKVSGNPTRVSGMIELFPKQIYGKATVPLSSLTASAIFANPTLAKEAAPIDKRIVLERFDYTDEDGDGIYEALVTMPAVTGQYKMRTVIEKEGEKAKEIEIITVIDPEGYIYEASGNQEIRINEATVTLHQKDIKTGAFSEWPAGKFLQVNPQITDKTGKYSFLVPEGTYRISAEAAGYNRYSGEEFVVVSGKSVHQNIQLEKTSWWKRLWNSFIGLFN